MNNSIKIGQLFPVTHAPLQSDKSRKVVSEPASSFKQMLDDKLIKFSHHAETRLEQRGIKLMPESISKISDAVDAAAQKGAKDSLIVYRDIAMIVNVPSRTVVTAIEGKQMQSNVFTQIDSAIILS
ncbi:MULTISPECIES: TIGR02530 family flagellar biosynthesis protein [unclassified Paenibacillus]|uniref:TIGR02530 family flagellar biosynthesis protein n=1 Tax=unclassified Paenibacillus TaxID=185978 RepID=UPI002F402F6B